MRNLTTLFLVFFLYFIVSLSSSVFAQSENVQQIPPVKDELLENYTQGDYENFLFREKSGEIPFQGGIVDQPAGSDALVNNNTGSTGTANFTQSETSILAFGNTVLIGFNDSGSFTGGANKFTGWSYSTDGGATFMDGGTLPTSGIGDAGDPVLAMNESTGRIYFSTLGFSGVRTIQVFRSDDGGVTWMAPVSGTPGGSSEDKQWIAVDNYAGAGNGNVYLMSRRFGGGPGIYMFRSTDNGDTFGPTGGVQIVSGDQGAFVVVGPDHSVYAFWYAGSTLQMRKSTDQAVTFGAPVTVASGLNGGVNGDLGLTGIRQGTASPSSFRSNEFPHVAVNPVSGDLYCTFANDPAGTDKADIYMVMSTDGGTTWSASVRVNDDATTTDQWQPTIAVTPNGNRIGIFYYSREEDVADNNLFKYYGITGVISGSTVTFSPSFPISDVASLPEFGRDAVVNSVYMGDYNHAAATNDKFHVVWSDNRDDLPGGGVRKDPNVYYEYIVLGPPCPVDPPTNPSPVSGAIDVPITLAQLSWDNGAGATENELWFGEAGSMVLVHSGSLISSWPIPSTLNYSTSYQWRVVEMNDTCDVSGPVWGFTTEPNPDIVIDTLFFDDFESGLTLWTITNNGGTCDWLIFNPPYPNAYTLPGTSSGGVLSADSDECGSGTTMNTTAAINGSFDFSTYTEMVWIEFDNDFRTIDADDDAIVEMSIDGGTSWVSIWERIGVDERNSHETVDITTLVAGQTNVQFRLISIQPGWDWWWTLDNFAIYGMYIVPVELTSFAAVIVDDNVQLNWTTATEINNQGFEIQRREGNEEYSKVGFVPGHGTTTDVQTYSYVDSKVASGNYTYRLKQIDFNGTFEYSDEVAVEVTSPLEYTLEQNYPNPFNPSTVIKYAIPEGGFVTLDVYNLLGEKVASLVNGVQEAGRYEINFDASNLASGIYVYSIKSGSFTSVKKMLLMK